MTDPKNALAVASSAIQQANVDIDAMRVAAAETLSAVKDQATQLTEQVEDLTAQVEMLETEVVTLQQELAARSIVEIKLDTTGRTKVNAALQKYLDMATKDTATADKPMKFKIPAGRYLVDAVEALWPHSNMHIELHPDAHFDVIPNDQHAYQVWNCVRLSNTRIERGQYHGDRDQHTYTVIEPDKAINDGKNTHEWGHAFRVSGCIDCVFGADYIENFTGDAFSIGAFKDVYPWVRSERVTFRDTLVNDCRRQGISIGGVKGVTLYNLTLNNIGRTNGTSPRCGIDLEPDTDQKVDKDTGAITRAETRAAWCDDVTVEDCTIDGAAVFGVNIFKRVQNVKFKNTDVMNSLSAGIKNVNGLDVHVLGGYIGKNGNTGLTFAAGTSGKVAGVVFDRNVVRLHPAPRPTPIIASGIVANTKHDLTVNSGATVDLREANEYR